MTLSDMRLAYSFVCLLLLALSAVSVSAQDYTDEEISALSSVELISEQSSIQPGTPFTLGLKMAMKPEWHSYWRNSGDSGEPTEIDWTLPDGFSADEIQWPYPHAIDAPPLRSYGYSDEVILLTEIQPASDISPGSIVEIEALAYWLICAEVCIPVEEEVSISLHVSGDDPQPTEHQSAFAAARADHPVDLKDWSYQATSNLGSYVLVATPPDIDAIDYEGAYFFVGTHSTLDHAAAQPITRDGDSFLIALQQSEYAQGTTEQLQGVLVAGDDKTWDDAGNVRALVVSADVEAAITVPTSSEATPSLPILLLLAFAGGLLLNLMPCVFPVLSIKILGFAKQADENAQSIKQHGFVFALGVILSFLLLAGLLLGLRAAGSQIGWGFQLQSPLFVAGMAMLFFAIGLNLLGVFEVPGFSMGGAAANASGSYQRSFFDGVLATLIATPCTAPFMGAALGAAVVMPTFQALLIFAMLGIGMAAPYVVLSLIPALIQRLPKPGPWMETLKQVLAFPMIATTIWLVWVFGNQTNIDGTALLLLGLLMLGLTLWILGRWPAIQVSPKVKMISRTLALVFFLMSLGSVYTGSANQPNELSGVEYNASGWQPYSSDLISQLTSAGQPVFIDFTATWCLTCQVNKRTTLNNENVLAAFEQKGVALFQADWTNEDPEITAALTALGRSGVPVYVLYDGSNKDPILLPEILTEAIVIDALSTLPDRALASN